MNDRRTTDQRHIYKKERSKEGKNTYGEFKNVHLTDEEYSKLYVRRDEFIESLSSYKESSGKKYKSDYATILGFMRRAGVSNIEPPPPAPPKPEPTEEDERRGEEAHELIMEALRDRFK